MKRITLSGAAAALTVPTLVLGVVTFYLLVREQDRQDRRARLDLEFKARVMAKAATDAVDRVQRQLMDRLIDLPEQGLATALQRAAAGDPLVRNAFLLDPRAGLIYPDDIVDNQEERRFLERYRRLFDDRDAWRVAGGEAGPGASASQSMSRPTQAANRGWKAWFWEDDFYLLGWLRDERGLVRGFEIETMALYGRLLPLLVESAPEATSLALFDHRDRLFFSTGTADGKTVREPSSRHMLGVPLPHWHVAAYLDQAGLVGSGRFLTAAGLLLLLALAAILVGGWSLIDQTRRSLSDAARKTNFVTNVSHELKTPLTTIRMYAELVGDGRVPDPHKQAQYLDVIIAESQRLTRLVNNVLEFGRLERGTRTFEMARYALGPLLEQVLQTQLPRLEEAGICVQTDLPDREVYARIDRDALEQVLLNLLDNAIKYGCTGEERRLELTLTAGAEQHQIRLRDHGPGVPGALREKVFEKFYRVDQTLASEQAGSGIGLSIARLMVDRMNGEIRYEVPPGPGAAFAIRLPAA